MPTSSVEDDPNVPTNTSQSSASQQPMRRKFSMALLNFWLDLALLLTLLFVGWVSAMMRVVFPAPTSADGWKLWGLTFNRWSDIQFFGLCAFGLLAIEHLVLHWNWVCSLIATKILRTKSRPDEANQAVFGVGSFITVLMVMLAGLIAAMLNVHRPMP